MDIPTPETLGLQELESLPLEELVSYFDWSPFFWTWELKGKFPAILEKKGVGKHARELYDDAQRILTRIIDEKLITVRGVMGDVARQSCGRRRRLVRRCIANSDGGSLSFLTSAKAKAR